MKKVTDDYIEKLESVDKKIIIKDEGLKITEDALLLSEFVKKKLDNTKLKGDIMEGSGVLLEIGSGQGIISLLLSEIKTIEKIHAVEIQKKIFEGATDTPCSLAIFMETESNLFIIDLQHNVFPQLPQSPTIFA